MKDKICRVLIADDEPIERMVVGKTLQDHFGDGIVILQAVNGREAIEISRREGCQIVLLDISMPGIDGLEAAETIHEENPLCSIIFLTAYDEFDFAKRAIRIHALDYMLKPWSKEELIAVVDEAIHITERNREKGTPVQAAFPEAEGERQEQPKNQAQMEFVRQYLEEHYMEDICLQDVAAALHYSDVYFCRFFKQNFDKNFI
ncbi:MAG: response regulator, partial [Butyrivibrio sp.]|nr:response regulator [Butyrivibrio sp.]